MEAAESVTNRHGPPSQSLAAFAVQHYPGRLDPLEGGAQCRRYVANHDEGAAAERLLIADRIRMPKIILAVAIAQGQTQGINGGMVATVKGDFPRQRPGSPGQERFVSPRPKLLTNPVHLRGQGLPTAQATRGVKPPSWQGVPRR